jgi:enoyl-CoA hydratase
MRRSTLEVRGVRLERQNGVTILHLDRRPANAIELPFAVDLEALLASLAASSEVAALVITGFDGVFSAGLDLRRVPFYGGTEQKAMVTVLNRLFGQLYGFPFPTVAAVNGHAIAGGLVLALACDYRVGADSPYQLGLTEVRVGVPYPVGAIAVVQAELPAPALRRFVLQGKNVLPGEALGLGVLDELQPPERVIARAVEVAQDMATLPRRSFTRIKRQLRAATLTRIEDAVAKLDDPMLESWLDAETPIAAAKMLRGKMADGES